MKTREQTLIILKPDAVQRTLVGEIVGRFERVGLKIVAMKFMRATPEVIERHYLVDPEWREKTGTKIRGNLEKAGEDVSGKTDRELGQVVLDRLTAYIASGPVLAAVLEGAHAIDLTRKLVGGTEPLSSDVGTIRGDYVIDSYSLADGDNRSVRNLVHASSSTEDAAAEIALWFDNSEILEYSTVHEGILYGDL